ncbi:MAG TPA: NAD(P)-binding domain-containing protein [Vicinamibacterales bacterium]|nr:NAD(P)-binding domain-containing protein [Vicinamibacterales bacterium]
MSETIGFIGLGIMGRPMARNLLARRYALVVHSRSPGPVDEIVSLGAVRAGSPADVARQATRIITMLPDSPDVELVLEGPEGVFSALQAGTILIDTSSIAPAVARRLADRARARGATMLDAPVSGGEIGAINASLSIMVGGDPDAFAAVKPILDAMGNPERVIRIGESGAGQICKVCNQMVIGGALAAVSEAFALARKAHIDPAKVREALMGGFAASRVLDVHGQRILDSNYTPGFRAQLYAKDLRIAGQTLAEYECPAPASSVVQQLVTSLVASGHGADDYSALATVIFRMAGL